MAAPPLLVGLTDAEAARRLAADGPNELPSARPRSMARLLGDVVREPMLLLLIGVGATYLLLGDLREASAIVGAIGVVVAITLYQQRKTERTLFALRELSSPRAVVIRDGETRRVAGRDVVRGDLVVLAEGGRVPADAVVESATNLFVDESLLTGESIPVRKMPTPLTATPEPPGGEDRPYVYSGTLVVGGSAVARVGATGLSTELGRIGRALSTIESGRTQLEREVTQVVRLLAVLGMSLCVAVAVGYGLTHGRWLDAVLAGLTAAIAMVPEEFPVVLTVFLALGAWRISQSRVLTRRIPAIETLGAATVLCVDKTGTLTMNRMAVETIVTAGGVETLEASTIPAPATRRVVDIGRLACKPEPFDPMERAFVDLDERLGARPARDGWRLAREYPLSSGMLAVANAWQHAPGTYVVAMKGAPEAVVELCHLDPPASASVLRHVEQMASGGLRVLGVASCEFTGPELPSSAHGFDFEFVGLTGLADPVRPGVPAALAECGQAGVRVVMLTGDYPATALHVARQIGLPRPDAFITGADLARLDDAELRRRIQHVDVFARMVPDQKLRLVNALKADGEVVAMTGDGVNDAPALKAADIGIAMGARGTDVAREAGALVLLDDDFASIVHAVRVGRRIYDNIRKAMAYVLAIHVPIAGISLAPVLFKWPLMLMPLHVIFLELIVDPACSIAFEMEPEEDNVMRRPPRPPAARVFERRLVLRTLLEGSGALAVALVVYGAAIGAGLADRDIRTLTFTTMIIVDLALMFANRTAASAAVHGPRVRNPAFAWIVGTAILALGVVLAVPF
ncbi:MAG: cation-translocating P-type ATPase, partial [Vicinamibacterales bacterium]